MPPRICSQPGPHKGLTKVQRLHFNSLMLREYAEEKEEEDDADDGDCRRLLDPLHVSLVSPRADVAPVLTLLLDPPNPHLRPLAERRVADLAPLLLQSAVRRGQEVPLRRVLRALRRALPCDSQAPWRSVAQRPRLSGCLVCEAFKDRNVYQRVLTWTRPTEEVGVGRGGGGGGV